ncbi:MoaD/ThiS family protein [uncultured Maricaulis sp.]|uniref:MoaD/ThiS family protein n=1 Tax=uncultured Maricaulis sp. TaxID=174710 RepID=UPI0030D969BA|tara:strand:- start:11227 stop:11475 length:249 start_codon:yes stop_codon:yes gene_type:complete
MALNIRYFAALRDRMGMAEQSVDHGAGKTGDALVAWLISRDPAALALTEPSVRLIINDEIAPRSQALRDGDTIAFCPPFSGG